VHFSDVDLVEGVLHVRQTLQRTGGQLRLGPVKTDGSERPVPIPPALVDVLKQHKERQMAEKRAAGDGWQEHGLLFTTSIGTPIEPRNHNRQFDRLCERAGVRRIRVHDLRHSCATLLYQQGGSGSRTCSATARRR
jgi:integrase